MRNLQPATSGVSYSVFCLEPKAQVINEFIDHETGEILQTVAGKFGVQVKKVDPVENRLEKFVLQSAVKKLLPTKRVSKCLRLPAAVQDSIKVLHNSVKKTSHFGGVQTCGSPWDCPCCATKISERRRVDEVLPAMTRWIDQGGLDGQGGSCYLLTLTHPHTKSDDLADLLKKEQKAMSSMTGSRAYRKLLSSSKSIGTIRAWEVTHGENGFHPHFHLILFARDNLYLQEYKEHFYLAWANACRLAKLPAPDRKGFDLQDGSFAHDYASKGVWGMDHEITKGHLKKAKAGRSPLDLVRSYAYDKDKQAGALFIEYSNAFHGKKQLYWSPGLKDYFKIHEKTDEQVAGEQDQQANVLGRIEFDEWKLILKYEMRGPVLELGRLGSWEPIARLINDLKQIGLKNE